jgi:opacity protein-like surface antigen
MKNLLLLAGAAALAATAAPSVAKPGNGKGNAHAGHAKHAMKGGKANRNIVMSDRFGRMYALNARGSCPPGLAKKGNGCMPPGHAKKSYDVGQRYNRNFGDMWGYNQIPVDLRDRYDLDDDYRYYYNQGYLYQVDPTTLIVRQVISALLG